MPSSCCFCPGCKSGYASDTKRGKYSGETLPNLFRSPKSILITRILHEILSKKPRTPCCPISRIICTDTKCGSLRRVQPDCDKVIEPDISAYPSLFLKDNFNIFDDRYCKQISISNNCNWEQLLKNEDFKEVLSKSSFSYDVNVASTSLSEVYFYSFEDVNKNSCKYHKEKPSYKVIQENAFFSSSQTKENDTGKPTEQQLLYIIDRLTYSLINFFEKPQDYTVYHKNVIFQNNIRGITTRGLTAYIQAMYILKLYGLLHYAKVKVEILKITHHIEDGTIRVRWRVNGISRHKLLINFWKLRTITWQKYVQDEAEWLDGFSVFSVDTNGLIYRHVCDKLTPNDDVVEAKKSDLKSKLLGLLQLHPRGTAAGSLHALMSCYKTQMYPNCKRIT